MASAYLGTAVRAETGSATLSPVADSRIFNADWGRDNNAGADTSIGIYQSRDRSLLRFDLSGLPVGGTMTSAILSLTATDTYGGNPTAESMDIHRLTQSWTEGGVTWNRYDGSTPWATAGGDYDASVWASSTENPASGSSATWQIASLAQAWHDGTHPNHGLILINSGTVNGLHFASKENGTVSYRPSLAVVYTTPTSAPVGVWTWNGGGGSTGAVDGAGTWETGTPWWNGAQVAWTDSNDVLFGAGNGAAGSVTISGVVAPKSLWFAPAGSGAYEISGGSIDLGGAVRIVDAAVDATIATPIGNGGLFKQGSGRLTLTGSNTYSGPTTILGGALRLGNGGVGGSLAGGAIYNHGGLIVDRSDDATLSSSIQGGGSLAKVGAGTLALSAANGYSGGTTVSGGVLRTDNNAALGAVGSTVVVRDGATLDIGPAELWNYTQAIEIAGNGAGGIGAITKSTNYNASLQQLRSVILASNASIGGVSGARIDIGRGDWGGNLVAAPIHIDGQGHTLSLVGNFYMGILAGAQNLAGFVIESGATAAPHSDNAFGSAIVTLNGGTLSPWNMHTFTNPLVLNSGFVNNQGFSQTYSAGVQVNGPVQFDVMSGGNIDLNGSLSGTGTIRKIGGWTLMLAGDNSAFSGTITNAESNVFFKNAAGGSAVANWVILSGANLAGQIPGVDSTFQLGSLSGAGRLANDASTGTVTFSIGALNSDSTFSGTIVDRLGGTANYVALTKVGTGTLTLSGPNTYSGLTAISGGTLRVTSAFLGDSSTIRIETGATNDLAFGGADIVQSIILGGASQPAGLYNATTHPAYLAGSGSLLIPVGTLIWDGAIDSNWDSATANWNGLTWTNLANAVFTSSVGTITLTQPATAAAMTFGTTADSFTGAFAGSALSVAANLIAQATGANDSGGPVLSFVNDVTVGGDLILRRRQVTLSAGTLRANRVTATDSWGMFNVAGATAVITNGIDDSLLPGGNTMRVTLTGGSLRTPYIKTTQASWRPAGANSDGVELNGGTLIPATNSSDFIQMADPGWGTRNQVMVGPGGANIDTDGRDITIQRVLIDYAGAGTLTKSGAGTLTLTAVNGFTGGTTVNGGLLNITGQSGGDGGLRGTVTVNSGAELRATGTGGAIFGYTGGAKIDTLNINGGLVDTVGGANHLWNATVNFNGGELRVNGGISDPNGYQLEWGNSSVNVASNDATAVLSGRIRIRPDANSNINFDVAAGLDGTNLLVSAAITETGESGITKKGAGNLLLAGTNTYTGLTVLEGGILDVAQLSNYGVAGSLGARTADGGGGEIGLLFRGGTLRYRGNAPQSTDRAIRLSTAGGGGTIDASGSSPTATVSFTVTSSPNFFENPGDRTLTLTGSNTGSNLFAMTIAEAGGTTYFNKTGPGTWILAGSNLYNGTTIVSGGTLWVDGHVSTGAVTVASGATLGGTGTIAGTITSSGTVAPGSPVGALTVNENYLPASGSRTLIKIKDASNSGLLLVNGSAVLDGTLEVAFTDLGYAPANGDTFIALVLSLGYGGQFAATNLPALPGALQWVVTYGPTSVQLSITNPVPPLAGYDLWATSITNGQTGYADSATGDGYANLLKYATGSNPTNSDLLARMDAARSGGVLALRFNRNTNATDVTLIVEGSSSAGSAALWTGVATNTGGSWGAATNVVETGSGSPVSVTAYDQSPSVTNRFLRLRVTRP